jgi:hypothetical protein
MSGEGSPTEKPTLNETLLNKRNLTRRGVNLDLPREEYDRDTVNSKRWGKAPFFSNAKPASMLEQGWKRNTRALKVGDKGLYTINDGPQVEVEVEKVITNEGGRDVYTFKDISGQLINPETNERFEGWDFYDRVTPVPFVRKGGTKKRSSHRRKKKTRRY